ncbi:MAG: efflux RND transporter periplasmic adaptor subunit [Candidatus Hydrogenedentes bacterium]|nr:efflux RND transporter periplasmic adaptor subunit [Candidatus Hydrogenedentota bacterium]
MKKFVVTAALCGVIVLLGGLVVYGASAKYAEREANRANNNHDQRVPNVKVQVIATGLLEDKFTVTGTVDGWENVTISAEVAGKVEWKGIDTGDSVKKDQELFRIDTEAMQTRYEQAKAQARLAAQEFDRVKNLTNKGVSAARDQDSAVANRDVAEADLRAMEIQLRKSVAKSPMDGVVAHVFSEQDEFTDVGKPLVNIVQLHKVKVRIGIPERDIPYFKVGDVVHVQLDAIPDRMFDGTIHLIAPAADLVTHTFEAEIAIDNTDNCLKPGMIARAHLVRKAYPDAIAVPIFSTALIDDKRFAFVEEDGKAVLREVEVGVIQGSNVHVTSGLKPGDRLIVVGQRDARPGEPVNVTETLQ